MPVHISGTHLQPVNLDDNTTNKLGRFGEWAQTVEFRLLNDDVKKCEHKDRERKIRPVIKELGYEVRDFNIYGEEVLISDSHIKSNTKFSAWLRDTTSKQARVRTSYLFG
jgi:hypothetical protein